MRQCFSQCLAVEAQDLAWNQAQLSLSHGGLGLRSLTAHSYTAYIASLYSSDLCVVDSPHLINAVGKFISQVSIYHRSPTANLASQRVLSGKLESQMFCSLLGASSIANKARLLAVSAPHAASWISVVPSVSLGLHLDPSEFQVAFKWWLDMDTSEGSLRCLCSEITLTLLATIQFPVSEWRNQLKDVFAEACRRAHFPVRIEMGSELTPDHNHS